jgi:hypothetical protein
MDPKNLVFDIILILLGAGLSVLFVCTDGNGKPFASVLAPMLVYVAISAFISFVTARFVRAVPFAVISSIAVTDLVLVLIVVLPELFSPTPDKHEHREMLLLWPFVLVVFTAPVVALSSIGFVRLAARFWQGRMLQSTQPASAVS